MTTEAFVPYAYTATGSVKRTAEQRERLADQAIAIAEQYRPVTLRQLYYVLVNSGWLAKTEREYKNLGNMVTRLRREGSMAWGNIIDSGRYTRQLRGWASPESAIRGLADGYTLDLWSAQAVRIYIGVEKEALAQIFTTEANPYQVPVVVARGYPSATYLHNLQQRMLREVRAGWEVHFFYYGDHDPSGDGIADLFQYGTTETAGLPGIFHRTALTAEQIEEQGYLTRPPKPGDSRTATWPDGGVDAADVDAIPPDELRDMIRRDIESVMDLEAVDEVRRQETDDRAKLSRLADQWDELDDD
jgi:hypothetical protein